MPVTHPSTTKPKLPVIQGDVFMPRSDNPSTDIYEAGARDKPPIAWSVPSHQIAWHRAFLGEMGFAIVPIEPDAAAIERIAIITCSGQWGDLTDEQRKSELIVARAAYDAAVKE